MVPRGNGDDNDWWGWRGRKDAEVMQHEEELRKLWDWQEMAAQDITALKTKMAIAAAMGSIIGGGIVSAFQHIFAR